MAATPAPDLTTRPKSGMGAHVDQFTGVIPHPRPSADVDALLLRVAAGERGALKQLYDRTAAKLYGISLRALGDEAEAQDVLQDVFVLVWTKAAKFDPAKAGAITWLSVLARNRSIDRIRARRGPNASLDDAADIASDAPSQFELIARTQEAGRLAGCLEQLDERARTMIRTAFLVGASYPQLAEREGVPLATMKSWIRRGLARLRLCLEQ